MASIARDPGGFKRILVGCPDGQRRPIRLGKVSQSTAVEIKGHIEKIAAAGRSGTAIPLRTADWLAEIGADLAGKLAAIGLIPKRDAPKVDPLGPFLESYVAGRCDVKPRTTINLNRAVKALVKFFGSDKLLSEVTPGDADEFRLFLTGKEKLADNTARRILGRSKQFFRAAVRRRLIRENPFGDMKGCTVKANPNRAYFVSRADAAKVLAACPDNQWRLLFALARFGGLRVPSEPLALTWDCVDWERNRLTIRSPKTAHFEGKESRVIPLFPELRTYLETAFEEAEPGTTFVVTRYRDTSANLRTHMHRIIRRAGLTPWPKTFQNLRATRETELAEEFPIHVVTSWLGNSQPVAMKHYLQVTDEHFARAAEQAAQNPAQSTSEMVGQGLTSAECQNEKSPESPGFASHGNTWHSVQMPPVGLEPTTR